MAKKWNYLCSNKTHFFEYVKDILSLKSILSRFPGGAMMTHSHSVFVSGDLGNFGDIMCNDCGPVPSENVCWPPQLEDDSL